MDLHNLLIRYLGDHQILLIFFGSFFFGDGVIISLAMLASQDIISIYLLLIFGFLGTIISDTLWFYASRYALKNKRIQRRMKENNRLIRSINRITGKRPFLFLLVVKFVYGTRILFIIYLAVKKLKYGTFILYDTIGTAIWITTLTLIGWLIGRGITNLLPILKQAEYLLTAIIMIVILMRLTGKWIEKRLRRE